jgi:2-hydroxychromene-2-carboxylate isomerase
MSYSPPVPERTAEGRPLRPPFALFRDRYDGPVTARAALMVFAAHGTPWSQALGEVIERVRERHLVAWRHYPDPDAHPQATDLALAVEAAGEHGRFWVLTRELLRDPQDLHAALVRAGLDPERIYAEIQAGTGAERIARDVASAVASGVSAAPTLFVNGERYDGELVPVAVEAALARAPGV